MKYLRNCLLVCQLIIIAWTLSGCESVLSQEAATQRDNFFDITLLDSAGHLELIRLDLPFTGNWHFEALLEDSIIISASPIRDGMTRELIMPEFDSEPFEGLRFYRYYISTGDIDVIGTIENDFVFSTGQREISNGIMYFYISIENDDPNINGDFQNILYAIDFENNKLFRLNEEYLSNPAIINVFYLRGNLISLKSIWEGNIQTSFLEVYNLDTNESTIALEAEINTDVGVGVMNFIHTTDDYYIYVLHITHPNEENDDFTAVIGVYDENINHIRDINIDADNFVFDSRPRHIDFFGNGRYIFMDNFSSSSFIGSVDSDGNISPIHMGVPVFARTPVVIPDGVYSSQQGLFRHSTRNVNAQDRTRLFFKRLSEQIVLFDTYTGDLREITIDMEDGFRIGNILTNGSIALISAEKQHDLTHEFEFKHYLAIFGND